jgi:hypothetical protein
MGTRIEYAENISLNHKIFSPSPLLGKLPTYLRITTFVPIAAQLYNFLACLTGRFTQPWLTGVPNLRCQ